MSPLIIASLEYRLGLTSDLCPTCGKQLPASLVVNAATVVDVREVWLEDGGESYEEITIVCVESRTAPPKGPTTELEAEQP